MKIFTTLLLILCSAAAFAKTAYVTDELKITLRTGESATHRIARMLPTGERLTVLSTNPATGYSKVRTAGGSEGFVLTRQLVDQPVARDRLAAAEAEVGVTFVGRLGTYRYLDMDVTIGEALRAGDRLIEAFATGTRPPVFCVDPR